MMQHDEHEPAGWITAHRFMAECTGAREVVEIKGASHAVSVSRPEEVADIILRAAKDVE